MFCGGSTLNGYDETILMTPPQPRLGDAYVEYLRQNRESEEVWPMTEILKLGTVWPDEANNRLTVQQVLPDIQAQILTHYQMYELLITSLRENGQTVPVRLTRDKLRLRDGIHRVAIAHSLGWESMKVSTGYSAWTEWDKSEDGAKYHTMWINRLKDSRAVSEYFPVAANSSIPAVGISDRPIGD